MPRFIFESRSGTRMTVVMSDAEAQERITRAGFLKVYRMGRYVPSRTFKLKSKIELARKDFAGISRHECWPMRSDAMGIEPHQIRDAMKADAELGLSGVTYDENTGQAIYADAASYKRHCEAHSFFDRNAGYSGPKRRDDREREIRGLPFLDKQEVAEYA